MKEQSYSQLKQRRDLMLNAKVFSIDDEDRETFQKAIDGLEKRMYRRVKIGLIVVSILVLASILVSGCGTMAGMQSDIHQVTRPTTLERK